MQGKDLIYLIKKTWFLILFAGGMGYFVIDEIYRTNSYELSQFIGSAFIPTVLLFAGLVVGFNVAKQKR